MQIGTVSGLRFCWRSWGFKINIRWNIVHFRKPNVCSNQLDVWETDVSFSQLNRSWNHFSRCKFTHGRYSHSHSLGLVIEKKSFRAETEQKDPTESLVETRCTLPSQTCTTSSNASTPTSFHQTLITFHQILCILVPVLCCMSLRTMRRWSKWLSKVEVPQRDMFHGPTELLRIRCLTGSIWTQKSECVALQ